MADVQLPVEVGIFPEGFCPASPQELADGLAEIMTVTIPAANTTVKIATSVTADDIGKLWIKIDADGNPLGSFIYDADVGDWVRQVPYTNTVPVGTIWDWFFADTEANAKAAALLLGQEDESTPNSANPYWRLCDGTNGTPDLRGRALVGAGTGAGLTPRANADIFGAETVALTVPELPQHDHIVGTLDSDANVSPNTLGASGATTEGHDGSATTHGMHTTKTGGDPGAGFATVAHANIPPSYAVWKIIKTARKY